MTYSIVIATLGRPDSLRNALASVAAQTCPPEKVVVVDASSDEDSARVTHDFSRLLPVVYQKGEARSAAEQRNQGVRVVTTGLVAFMDDDVVLEADLFAKLTAVFRERPATGGVAGRMRGFGHKKPGRLLWMYYRLQAGYSHPTYGARLFGPAINCLPCYEEDHGDADLIEGQWLPAGVVLFKKEVFPGFPAFPAYSAYEDVYASARVSQKARLYFHREAWYIHESPLPPMDLPSALHRIRQRFHNQKKTAREVLQMKNPVLFFKMLFHKLFVSATHAKSRDPHRADFLRAIWFPAPRS